MSDSFSYSNLQLALRCNRLYQHIVIDKLKPVEDESLELHFGTALHCGLTALLEGGDASAFGAYWASVREMQFANARNSWDELATIGDTFLERFERLHLKHYTPRLAEKRLYALSPAGVRLEGTPDFVGTYKGKLSVVDFKSSGSRYANEKIQCSDQLLLYAYLAQQELKQEIKQIAYVVFIKGTKNTPPSIQTLEMELSQELLNSRIANIELQCNELQAKQVFHQNFNGCMAYGRRCAFYNKCHGNKEG